MSDAASSFGPRYGPWALVAGASMGLGAEYARQIAAKGLNLVLVAWPADGLEKLAGFFLNRLMSRRGAVELLARSMRRIYPNSGKPS